MLLDSPEGEATRRVPTQEDVENLNRNLEYEVWMLRETSDYLADHREQVGQAVSNAYLESFLLHARSLIDFFFPPEPASMDRVIASDFVPDWSSHASLAPELAEIRETARRTLSRISYAAADFPRQQQLSGACDTLEDLREDFEELLAGVGL
jgi:hypothetical protein